MILVDTCVWIDLFKGIQTPQVQFLEEQSLTLSKEICLNHIIYFEVLRGIRSDKQRSRVKIIFQNLKFFDHHNNNFDQLIVIYQKCQKQGFTLSKLGDWLIFKSVLDHSLELLTSDQDFFKLNQIHPFALVI